MVRKQDFRRHDELLRIKLQIKEAETRLVMAKRLLQNLRQSTCYWNLQMSR